MRAYLCVEVILEEVVVAALVGLVAWVLAIIPLV